MNCLNTKIPPPLCALLTAIGIYCCKDQFAFIIDNHIFQHSLIGLFLIAGFVFDLSALRSFYLAKTTISPLSPNKTQVLVSTGVYRFSRNPMYLGLTLLLCAWGLYLSTLLAIPVIACFIVYITRFQILPEEAVLQKKYPKEFSAYKQQVRMWI